MTQSTKYEQLKSRLINESHTWLITGVAGFIVIKSAYSAVEIETAGFALWRL